MTETTSMAGDTVDSNAVIDQAPAPQTEPQQNSGDWTWWNQNWASGLPQQYQSIAAKYHSLTDCLDGFLSSMELNGKKVEDFKASHYDTYSKLMKEATGIPADASGYEFGPADGTVLQDSDVSEIKNLAAAMQLNEKQGEVLCDAIDYGMQAIRQEQLDRQVECFKELAQSWGNSASNKLQAIKACITDTLPRMLGYDSNYITEKIADSVSSNPLLLEIFARIGELATGSTSQGYQNMTPTNAVARLDQLRLDPDSMEALTHPWNPRHSEVKQQIHDLFTIKNGGR